MYVGTSRTRVHVGPCMVEHLGNIGGKMIEMKLKLTKTLRLDISTASTCTCRCTTLP